MADALCTLHEIPQDRRDAEITAGTQDPACLNRQGDPNAADIVPVAERYFDNYLWRLDPYEIPKPRAATPEMLRPVSEFNSVQVSPPSVVRKKPVNEPPRRPKLLKRPMPAMMV